MTSRRRRAIAATVSWISLALLIGTLLPSVTRADVWGLLMPAKSTAPKKTGDTSPNLQIMDLPQPAMNVNPMSGTGGGDVDIVDDSAVVAQDGPSGTLADIVKPKNGTITTYIVREGDTLSSIAQMFGIPQSTILWANDLTNKSKIKPGDKLTILPVPGIRYAVKAGDTLASIAKHYGADSGDIASYNAVDDSTLTVGSDIIIPDAELPNVVPASKPKLATGKSHGRIRVGAEPAHDVGPQGDAEEIAYYIAPLSNYVETQGIHGYNAVDLAAPIGTPIVASAAGDVVVAREGGWNGGYGSYVVISHDNGSQTLYGHMSKVATYDGAHVEQGQVIGYVGQTGLATGPHVHFEIRNGIRNPF